MKDKTKAKNPTTAELKKLRRRMAELEQVKSKSQQTEKALRESEEKYRALVESATDFIYMIDTGNKVLSLNKAAAKLWGQEPKDLIGKSIAELFPKATATRFSRSLKEVFKTGAPSSHESKMVAGGREFCISVNLSPVRDHRGKVVAVMGVTRDITRRMLMEKRYQDLVEKEKDIIYSLDQKGVITFVNPAVKALLGYKPEELLGKSFLDLVPEEMKEKAATDFNTLLKTGEITAEISLLDNKGRKRFLEYTSTVVKEDKKILGTRGVARDITERKMVERELEKHREHLEELIAERTVELMGLNKQLRWEITERKRAEERTDRLNALKEDLLSPLSLDEKLNRITDGVVAIFEADFARIWITKPGDRCHTDCFHEKINKGPHVCRQRDRCLHLMASSGQYRHMDGKVHRRVPFGCYKIGRVAAGQESKFITNDVTHDPWVHNHEWAEKLGLISFAGYRLLSPTGEPIGVLALFCKHRISPEEDVLLEDLSNTAAQVIQTARAEEALQRSELQYRTTIDSIGDALHVVNSNLQFVLVNKALKLWNEKLGLETDVIGRSLFEVFPFLLDSIRDEYHQVFDTGSFLVTEERSKIGDKEFVTETRKIPVFEDGKVIQVVTVIHDITERKRVEAIQSIQYRIANAVHTSEDLNELLRAIQQDLNTVLDTKNFFIALYDRENDTLSLPYFRDEKDHFETFPAGKTLTAYVIKHDLPLLATSEEFQRLALTGEVETVGTDSKIWLGVPLKANDEIIGALVVQSYTDENAYDKKDLELLKFVSSQIGLSIERKKAEEALRGSEERYRIITDQTGQLVYDYDVTSGAIDWSGAIEAVTGYSLKEFQKVDNNRWKEMIHPEDKKETLEFFDAAEGTSQNYRVEYRFRTKKGEYRNIQEEGVFLRNEDGKICRLLGIMKDVTERKRAEKALRDSEEQLRQSQKMEAVGRLAGGIAHDLNNLLTGVTGYSDLLSARIDEQDPLHKYILEIQKATHRATTLIRQLLAFSRKQMLQPKVLNLNETVKDIEKMLRRIIGEDIELNTVLDPKLEYVKADPGQMEQVIMNLAVNARDAMPQGGRLTIETTNVDLDETYARLHADSQPGRYVMLAMSDTGDGMDEEIRSHIFEPFFTTKEVGKGTGLGLSTVYGIVKQSDGNIWVYSEPGKGTTFKVYLPQVKKDGKPSKPGPTTTDLQQGSETILVVEDEDIVRQLVQEILQQCGYAVLVARNGEEALSISKRRKEPIHLMVTDVVMPQMNGRELAKRITQLRSGIRVLYISGYSDDFVAHRQALDSRTAFLQKPFTSEALARKVRQVLDAAKRKKVSPKRMARKHMAKSASLAKKCN
jgi:PAS domain S-box-containing protein